MKLSDYYSKLIKTIEGFLLTDNGIIESKIPEMKTILDEIILHLIDKIE